MRLVNEFSEVVILHGVAHDDPCGEGGNYPHDDVEDDGPKETEPPQIESRHEGQQRCNKHNVSYTHMTSHALLLAQCFLVSFVVGEDIVGVFAPLTLCFFVTHRPCVR